MAPVAQRAHVAQVQTILQAQRNAGHGPRDLAGDEGFTTQRAFMVEQHAVAGIHAIGFAVVHRDPVGIHLGHRIRAARVEGRGLLLRDLLHQAVQLAGAGLVEAGLVLQPQDADGLQQAQGADAVCIGHVFGLLEAHRHMAHCAQVVDLVRLRLLHDADQVGAVRQITVVQLEALVVDMRVLVQMVHAVGVEQAGAALDAVHRVALLQQQFRQVGAVLAGDAGDECSFHGWISLVAWRPLSQRRRSARDQQQANHHPWATRQPGHWQWSAQF